MKRPLASTVKIIVLAEFADQVAPLKSSISFGTIQIVSGFSS
ncbi:hypothetical protein [Paenibacillus sp. SN-8-1]